MTQATTGSEVNAGGNSKVDIVQIAGTAVPTGGILAGTMPIGLGNAVGQWQASNFIGDGAGGADFPVMVYWLLGSNYDRAREAAAVNLAAQSGLGAALVAPPGQWAVVSTPAAGTQATASKAAGAAGVRHVYMAATFTHGAIAAPAATLLQANVRDGATGVGTVIDAAQAAVQAAVAVTVPIPLSGKNVPGTAATAMTAEYSASLANLAEGATIQGYDAS